MITILGPTASGKTTFAAHLAAELDGEIISADSRQVYRGMDLGTGKDLADYTVNGQSIPYHLIDICDAGEKYNVYMFQRDFGRAYDDIISRGKMPILCGGTGLYIESILRDYNLPDAPQNPELRASLEGKSLEELTAILRTYKSLHNTTDVDTAQRAIRAIEIEEARKKASPPAPPYRPGSSYPDRQSAFPSSFMENEGAESPVIGLAIDRDLRREKISQRLQQRLDEGMLDEIRHLLDSGVKSDDLIYYGLEYKYLTLHVIGQLSYDEMFRQLEIAIHQFAKRQMTWFRGMERRGIHIHWLDATLPMEEKIARVKSMISKFF